MLGSSFGRRWLTTAAKSPRFSTVSGADLQAFESMLGRKQVLTGTDELTAFNQCWQQRWQGQSQLALLPTSTQQVSEILAYCNQRSIAVVPQGGNTGQVGGSVPTHDEVVLSLKKMDKILGFDDVNGILSAEAGCILEDMNNYVLKQGFDIPYNIGSRGSCQLGGNLATNCGGSKVVRYGSMRANLVGMEAVLADGTVLHDMSNIRKDNSGYDLKQLFVGSEGTLGVIT